MSREKEVKKAIITECEKYGLLLREPQVEALWLYCGHFLEWSKVHNLSAVKDMGEMLRVLVGPCISASGFSKGWDWVIDWGSGGGIPGVVFAIINMDTRFLLVERSSKKCAFLREVILLCGLKNMEVYEGDFSSIDHKEFVNSAVFCRGACKLNEQVRLTKKWRDSGVRLFSFQKESMQERGRILSAGKISVHDLGVEALCLFEVS